MKYRCKSAKSLRRFRVEMRRAWGDSGGLEGLPLQLIIMMVIAGIGIGIVVGWLTVFSEKPLNELVIEDISPEPTKGLNVLTEGEEYTITVRALNTDQKPIEGVTITLEGPGVAKIATTDSQGMATFSDVTPDLGTNENLGLIHVKGSFKSWTSTGPVIGIEA
jgi:hypothetical protein